MIYLMRMIYLYEDTCTYIIRTETPLFFITRKLFIFFELLAQPIKNGQSAKYKIKYSRPRIITCYSINCTKP